MRPDNRYRIYVLLAALAVFFFNLGAARLWDEDEPKNASCAAEMLARGDWIVPTFNDQLRSEKPVLLYWFMMTAYHVFGVNEFGARFWSAAFAVGTALMTYEMGRKLYSARLGLWAGLAMASCLMFGVSARAATPDSTLIFFTTAAMWFFVWGVSKNRIEPEAGGQELVDPWHVERVPLPQAVPNSWYWFVGIYASLGLAMLAKGPVGVLFPVAVLGLFLLLVGESWKSRSLMANLIAAVRSNPDDASSKVSRFVRRLWLSTWALRPFLLVGVVLLVAAPWYVAVFLRTDGQWVYGFFGKHNFGRFAQAMEGHNGPFFYYIIAILGGFFPWSIMLPLATLRIFRRGWGKLPGTTADRFLVCWAAVWIIIFSASGTKLPSYVLPAYPALALIVARMIDAWIVDPRSIGRPWLYIAWGSLAVVGIGLAVGLPIAAHRYWTAEYAVGLAGLIPLAMALVGWWYTRQDRPGYAIASLAVGAPILCMALLGGVAVRVSAHHNSANLMDKARQLSDGQFQLASYLHSEPSVVFYAHKPVLSCQRPAEMLQFFADAKGGFMITNSEAYQEIVNSKPADVVILAREQRFLRPGEVLLLGRPPKIARAATVETIRN